MATIRPFQVNNGLEVNLNANVVGTVSAAEFIRNVQAPSVPPTLYFDFAKSNQVDSRISFTRSTSATFFAGNGLIAYANTNVPRFEYTSGVSRGLLIEDQRTNIYRGSVTPILGTNEWNGGNLSYVANTTSPDGTNNAIVVSNSIDIASLFSPNRDAYVQNSVYTKSIFAKAIAGSNSLFFQAIVNATYYAVASFNLTTGVASTGGDANSRVSMVSVGNNWWRCIQTFKTDPSASLAGDSFFIGGYGATSVPTQMALWGWQSEQGTEATSLIVTPTNSSATRTRDDVRVPINPNATWYNSSTGTCYGEYTLTTQGRATFTNAGYTPGYPQFFGFVGGDPNNVIMAHYQNWAGFANSLGGSTTGSIAFLNYNDPTANGTGNFTNVDSILNPNQTVTIGSTVKAAFSYSSNNMIFGANGITGTTSYVNANPTATSLFLMQEGRFQLQPTGYFKKFVYYPTKLTATEIQFLTS